MEDTADFLAREQAALGQDAAFFQTEQMVSTSTPMPHQSDQDVCSQLIGRGS